MTSAGVLAARLSAWRPPPATVGIVALGQAGFALRSGDDLVLIDPFLSPLPERLAEPLVDPRALVGVGVVLATHEHGDHLDLPTWAAIAATSPDAQFIVPEPLVPRVTEAGIPGDRVSGARIGHAIEIGRVRATAVPARHAVEMEDGYSLGDAEAPRFVGYVVELDGARLYHAGDSLADDAIVRAAGELHPEIALLPINGRDAARERRGIVGNMSPDEAAGMARDLSVALAIPMHFDAMRGNTGEPDAFVRAMRELHPSASVWVPGVGGGIVWPAHGGAWRAAMSEAT
jgi:L-ascorbate metabolism protein UlaG (beta-lactamase superfamily)